MTELKYPIGMQTFSKIREDGYAYVDKTRYIKPLLDQGQFIFLSRPRRFGKSLFVSTLKSFFEGKRYLFEGLDIYEENVDWTPLPVLHFDFNSGLYSEPDGLRVRLDLSLSVYEQQYGIIPTNHSSEGLSGRMETLIRCVAVKTNKKVVILIDEYDKPLLGLENYPDILERNQKLLKSFFGNLKSMDEYIRFGFISGVARFSKVSIFSDLNNLDDISLDNAFADICGLTESELTATFRQGIVALAEERKESYNETLDTLRLFYDGYLFTSKGSRLYNPFSVMRALKSKEIDPFWFETGSPTFLIDKIKNQKIDPQDINGRKCTKRDLMQVNIESKDPIPLMFQTGYLTIDHYNTELQEYTLRFPNREVEIGFAEELLPLYVNDAELSTSPFAIQNFRRELILGDPEAFMRRLQTVFKDLPSEDNQEAVYRAVTYLICKLCSMNPMAENHSYKGRSDMEVFTSKYIYVLEFKYNHSADEAIQQIHSKDYAGRYALDGRKIFLIGANYDSSKTNRGLSYIIESVQ